MAILMKLPLEMRLNIIDIVLFATRDAPNTITVREEDRFQHSIYRACRSEISPHACLPNGQGLLLTSKQLREETLSRLRQIELSLDIVMVDEELLYLTWTCIPVNSRHVDILKVNLRISGIESGEKESKLDSSPGGRPLISLQFHGLLQRFLRAGPAGMVNADEPTADLHYTVGALEIDILTPTDLPPGFELNFPSADDLQLRRWTGPPAHANQIISAEKLCLFLYAWTYYMFSTDSCINAAQIINERVGKIYFRVDGEEVNGMT